MRKYLGALSDLLILGGSGCLVYGVWQISYAAAWIVGGIILAMIGILAGLNGRGK